MGHFLKKLVYFFLFVAVFIFLNIYFQQLPRDTWRDFSQHYRQYKELSVPDIKANAVIIGTSIGAHSIRPSLLNNADFSFFNFAFNGANPKFYLDWYTKIFADFYPKPKYFIYEVDNSFTLNSDFRKFEQHYKFMPGEFLLKSGLFKDIDYKESKDLFITYLKETVRLNALFIYEQFNAFLGVNEIEEHVEFNKAQYKFRINRRYEFFEYDYDNGFIPFITRFENPIDNNPGSEEEVVGGGSALKDNRKDFENLVQLLEKNGTKVILVMCPRYVTEEETFEVTEAMEYYKRFSQQHNIPFLNYNLDEGTREINRRPEYFSDKVHMSPLGSKQFSKILSSDIQQYMN